MPAVSDFRFLVVAHTHWDREWYLPFEQFRLRLGDVVDGVLDALESDSSFSSFTLDGQAIVLEDYLEVRPEHEGRLRALLADGRLEAGPWYVLPDELLVGSESLVRNLLLGRRVCRRFGVEPTAAGYEPDSFGHTAQLPQVLAGFGIGTFIFSRGLGDELDDVGVVFRWRAGPAKVVASQQLPHYDNFARLDSAGDGAARVEWIVRRFGARLERAACTTVLLANGSDHLPVQPELPRICAELEARFGTDFRIGRLADFRPADDGLPEHEGELVGSRLQNVLRGVNSARMYLKQANEAAERRLLAAETGAALQALRGRPFPAAAFRLAWRDLLRNHPHDSICGCSCDEVHRDMVVRYDQLDRTLELLEARGPAVVNTLPFRRTRLVRVGDREAIVELDGFSARVAELDEREPAVSAAGTMIENGLFRVEALPNGTVTVTDHGSGRRFEGLLSVETAPDAGDLYTFCRGGPVTTAAAAGARVLHAGTVTTTMLIAHELPGIYVETVVSLVRGVERVEFRTTVENVAENHRLASGSRSRRASHTCERSPSSPSSVGPSNHPRRERRGRSRLCKPHTRSERSLSGRSRCSRRVCPSTRRAATRCGSPCCAASARSRSRPEWRRVRSRPARTSPLPKDSVSANTSSSTRCGSTPTGCRMRR